MRETLQLAVVGCGRQMQENLLPFLRRIHGHKIVACVDPDLALVQQVQLTTQADISVGSVEALDLQTIDAALIAVPPRPSAQITRFLVEHGVDCFVEKPAGPSTAALQELDDAVRRSARHVQVGFNFRYAEALQRLYELTEDTRTRPCAVTIDYYSRHPSRPQWGVNTTLEAWIRHNGVHAFDLVRWFVPAAVARVYAHAIQSEADRFIMTIVMWHEDGSLSTVRMGNQTQSFLIGASVQGADGSRFTAPSLEQIRLDVDAGKLSGAVLHATRNLDHGWARSGFGPELAAFLQSCRRLTQDGASWPSTADAAAASILCDLALDELSVAEAGIALAGRGHRSSTPNATQKKIDGLTTATAK